MPKETHRKKHRSDAATKENQNKDDRASNQLFSKADANSVELSGYTAGYGSPQRNGLMPEHSIPTGVAAIHKSVKLPPIALKPQSQNDPNLSPAHGYKESLSKSDTHMPPITDPNQQYSSYPSHIDSRASNNGHPYVHFSHPYPIYPEHPSTSSQHHHHNHRHHRRHHHHRHHHKHVHERETYDPRWWYLPQQTVHTPRRWQPPSSYYVPPKWYESSSNQTRIFINSQESIMPVQKYADCRCDVCRPSKQTPRGVRWIVNN